VADESSFPPSSCPLFPGESSSQGFLLRDAALLRTLGAGIGCAKPLHAGGPCRQCHATDHHPWAQLLRGEVRRWQRAADFFNSERCAAGTCSREGCSSRLAAPSRLPVRRGSIAGAGWHSGERHPLPKSQNHRITE